MVPMRAVFPTHFFFLNLNTRMTFGEDTTKCKAFNIV
jgi:hypothetical protein